MAPFPIFQCLAKIAVGLLKGSSCLKQFVGLFGLHFINFSLHTMKALAYILLFFILKVCAICDGCILQQNKQK